MQVLKFGGTSIGNSNQIKKTISLINLQKTNVVVFSAFSGVTNLLSEFIQQSKRGNYIVCNQILKTIKNKHTDICYELLQSKKIQIIAINKIEKSIKIIEKFTNRKINGNNENLVLAQGEILSVMLIYLYLLENEIDVAYIPALNFMKTRSNAEPNYKSITSKLNSAMKKYTECRLFITSGFICKNHRNKVANLNRGGSDYTATIIGKVLNANVIEIWTDIDGLHNNDPRFVEQTESINNLSYEEASELAFFGAKVLHPSSITPAQYNNIPIVIKNTMNPSDVGTIISDYTPAKEGLKAIAAKDGITTIKIRSGRMMQAYGFLRKVFEVFEKYKTSVDMLTTSEVSIAMTIENTCFLDKILKELSLLGNVETETNQSIICIVGDFNNRNENIKNIIKGLENIPVQMISFGASKINISFVINSEHKIEALNLLNTYILKANTCLINN